MRGLGGLAQLPEDQGLVSSTALAGWRDRGLCWTAPCRGSRLGVPLRGRQGRASAHGCPPENLQARAMGLRGVWDRRPHHGEELSGTGGRGTSGPEPEIGFLCSPHAVLQELAGRLAAGAGWAWGGGPGRPFAWEEGLSGIPFSQEPLCPHGAPGGREQVSPSAPRPRPQVTLWAWHRVAPAWGTGLDQQVSGRAVQPWEPCAGACPSRRAHPCRPSAPSRVESKQPGLQTVWPAWQRPSVGRRSEPEPQSRLCSDTRGCQAVHALSFLSSGTLRLTPTAPAGLSLSTKSRAISPLPSPWPLGAGPAVCSQHLSPLWAAISGRAGQLQILGAGAGWERLRHPRPVPSLGLLRSGLSGP